MNNSFIYGSGLHVILRKSKNFEIARLQNLETKCNHGFLQYFVFHSFSFKYLTHLERL